MNAATFIEFLKSLLKSVKAEKIFLIVDGSSIHKAKKVKEFLARDEVKDRLEIFILPGYSPELNPDEWVWNNVKNARLGRAVSRDKNDLKSKAIGALRRLQKIPALTPADPATATELCSPIIDEHHGSPLHSFIPGNGNVNLYFDSSGAATSFCGVTVFNGAGDFIGYQFYANGTSACLALDSSTSSIHEGSATACSGAASYTLWLLGSTSNASYALYQSEYNGDCIYDNTQRPVTYSGCSSSNQFEWLTVPST